MMRLLACLFCTLLLPMAARAQTLQLADGRVLLAAVEEGGVDGQGLRVRRLDNGGVLELRWEHLSPDCAQRLKQHHGLAGETVDEMMVTASLVSYVHNGSPAEIIGIVDQNAGTGDHVIVQNKGVSFPVPKRQVRFIKPIEVPVAQVYTKEEYYSKRLVEMAPGDQADRHVLLAQELIKVRDYEHAKDHLLQAQTLGNSKAPGQIPPLLERLERYREAAKERELLDLIQVARARGTAGDFEKGLKLIADYEQQYPGAQARLRAEFETEKKRFAEARTRFLSGKVAEYWRRGILSVADRKVGEPGLTLNATRDFATSKMAEEIVTKVAGQLSIAPEEVRELWQGRAKYPIGRRTELFVYGIGSWVLGDAAILKDTKQGQRTAEAPKDPAQEREIERIARAFRAAMERRQRAAGGPEQNTEEDWWQQATRNEKTSWLRAYYAEFSGDLVVTAAFLQACVSCGGEGTVPEVVDGKVVKLKCFLCRSTKFLRSFYAY